MDLRGSRLAFSGPGSAPEWLFRRLMAAWPARPGLCRCEGCVVVFLQLTGIFGLSCGRSNSQQEQKFGESVLGGQ